MKFTILLTVFLLFLFHVTINDEVVMVKDIKTYQIDILENRYVTATAYFIDKSNMGRWGKLNNMSIAVSKDIENEIRPNSIVFVLNGYKVVRDRVAGKNKIDILLGTRKEAINFGCRKLYIFYKKKIRIYETRELIESYFDNCVIRSMFVSFHYS